MQLIRYLPEHATRPSAVAIGNFDGLHRGHQAVLAAMVKSAQTQNLIPSVLTFEPHPRRFFQPQLPAFRIERLATKLHRLEQAGVAHVAMPRFDAAFAAMPAEAFLEDVLARRLGAKVVVTGENFAFGHKRRGDTAMLQQWGAENRIEIITVLGVLVDGIACSSSAVRAAITAGDMARAHHLLGREYTLEGRVVHGDGRGAGIGFPTANVAVPANLLLPAYGVYAVRANVGETHYHGVANFGVRPTVDDTKKPSLEVHLFDAAPQLYGAAMEVLFVQKIRDEKKFDGITALTEQIVVDCTAARIALGKAHDR